MQMREQLKEPGIKQSLPAKELAEESKIGFAGWAGFGLLAACGICCSLPFLAGIAAALGTTLVFSMLWPLVGLGLALGIGITFFWWSKKQSGKITSEAGSTSLVEVIRSQVDICSATSCNADGSCGCKK